jgi:hypothetical protein
MKICRLVLLHQSKIFFIFNKRDLILNFLFSVKDILGYSRNEMIGNWLGRYLATNDLEKFEAIRQKYCKNTIKFFK